MCRGRVAGSVVDVWRPPATPSTSYLKVQDDPAGMDPSWSVIVETAVVNQLSAPQVPVRLSGLAKMMPAETVSVTDTPVRSVSELGFVIVKVSVDHPLTI
jgi:hypothetical protein